MTKEDWSGTHWANIMKRCIIQMISPFKFPNHPKNFHAILLDKFPDEKEALISTLGLSKGSSSMRPYYLSKILPSWASSLGNATLAQKAQKFLTMKTHDVISSLTDNYQLRQIFVAQWGYYGSLPKDSSFAMQALVVRHFSHGGYYPIGGSGSIAHRLLQKVTEGGGWTRICADYANHRRKRKRLLVLK